MTTEKRIDRKSFLTTGVAAWAAVTLGACSGESDTGGTDDTGGANTGGTGVGGANTGGTSTGGAGTGGIATGGNTTGGVGTGGSTMGGAGAGGKAMGGAGTGGNAIAGTSGSGSGGAGSGGASGGGTGGSAGSGGGTLTCTTETSNGTHSHPLVVPPSDVERSYQDAPYVLEDGGTGHTHTVVLDAYEFIYLQGGTAVTHESSETEMHTHQCVITCVVG